MDILSLLKAAKSREASDIHLVVASPPLFRINGSLQSANGLQPISAADVDEAFDAGLVEAFVFRLYVEDLAAVADVRVIARDHARSPHPESLLGEKTAKQKVEVYSARVDPGVNDSAEGVGCSVSGGLNGEVLGPARGRLGANPGQCRLVAALRDA